MIDRLPNTRVALAHDWLVGLRGGEWVLDRLARLFGPTRLYTLVSNGRPITEAIAECEIVTSPLQRLPGASGAFRRHYLPVYPWSVGRLRVEPCDLLVSTSSAVMKSIVPPEGTPHLCYCHSPARYVWEQTKDYAHGAGGRWRSLGLRVVKRRFQDWDRATSDRVTTFLANSRHTADRIRRCFDREAHVVHPPVRTDYFTVDPSVAREDWFLVVSALEPYKRTDLVVDTALARGLKLKVAGQGSQLEELKARAGDRVEILGRVDDDTLRDLYRRAAALIFPQVEDFGIIAVEAQSAGCPVIAFRAGGALETVRPDTGVLFDDQTPESLGDAINAFQRTRFDPQACRANAERFASEVFDEAIMAHARKLLR